MAEKDKYRYFCFEVYPESAPDDWIQILRDTHAPFAISPLHTLDENGEPLKPHWHVIYRHSNPITLDCAYRNIPDDVPANGKVDPVPHPHGYQRYLIHLDDPDKQQFSGPNEITVINAFPLDLSRDYSKAELNSFRDQIFEFIQDYGLLEYCDLIDFLRGSGNFELLDYATTHTILYNSYLASRRGKLGYSDFE